MNGYEPFDGFLVPFVNEGSDPRDSTETISAWGLHQIGDSQGVSSIPALGLMDRNTVEDRPSSSNGPEASDLPDVERFVCIYCNKRFKSQNDVDRHRSSVHDKHTPYFCSERENCRLEKQRRQEVEEELKNLRQRYEEREDMWLKLLVTKEGRK